MKYKLTNLIVLWLLLSSFNWIDFIKSHEGFRPDVYTCPSGKPTIGYGHVIKPGEEITSLDTTQATQILLKDFTRSIYHAKRYHPNLNDTQIAAVAHLIYSIGIGNYSKSGVYIAIRDNKSQQSIYAEWIKWGYYKQKVHPKKMFNRNVEFFEFKNGSSTSK